MIDVTGTNFLKFNFLFTHTQVQSHIILNFSLQEWLIPSENISFSMKSYIDPQNKREYNSGNCSFKHSLTPFVDASYKYHAIFQPGEVLAEAQTLKIGLINLFPPTPLITALW